jgi:hypothetical protein
LDILLSRRAKEDGGLHTSGYAGHVSALSEWNSFLCGETMTFSVSCQKCGHKFICHGEEDWQDVGDGGPSECTGVELTDFESCPKCGHDEVDIEENVSNYDD